MALQTDVIETRFLKMIVADNAAGFSNAQIAARLVSAGVTVPRTADLVLTAAALGGRRDGYCLGTDPGTPGRWTAAAVAAVLAAPEAVTTGDFAAARAKLGSHYTTTLTV